MPEAAAFCPACGASTPTDDGPVASPGEHVQQDHRRRLQDALGSGYQLRELIGEGGFGRVYRAVDLKLKRAVAVKVIRAELLLSTTSMERFQRESQAVAQLRHPNVIPVYSVGEAGGLAYFIMPLIAGITLRQALEQQERLSVQETLRIVGEVASALETAHQAGLVHRDIKPDNIMLEGVERRVLLMDFGVAKALAVEGEELTASGALVGTPLYMSPEQASGETHIDHRSDIYSLGVVAFQMLTGAPPFTAETARGVIAKHITEAAPAVTHRRVECPPFLAEAVARCLAKEPGDRWESAGALLKALRSESVRTLVSKPAEGLTPEAAHPVVRRMRWGAFGYVAITGSMFVIDLTGDGSVDFAPAVLILGAFFVAGFYGSLVTAGFTWRDALSRGGSAPRGSSRTLTPSRSDSSGIRSHAAVVQKIRSERATMAGLIAPLPKSERDQLEHVLPTVDKLIARAAGVAKRLDDVELRIETEKLKLEKNQEAISSTGGGVWDLRSALAEREEKLLGELDGQRGDLTGQLRESLVSIYGLRDAVGHATDSGVSSSMTEVQQAIDHTSRH